MNDIQRYLDEAIGSKYHLRPYKWKSQLDLELQNYEMLLFDLFGVEYLLVFLPDFTLPYGLLKDRLERIETQSSQRVVLTFDKIAAKDRKKLISDMIPFIVPDSQIFIPRYFISLKESFTKTQEPLSTFSPAEQVVFLYLFYQPARDFTGAFLAKVLNYSPMSLSRILNRFEQTGLLKSKGIHTAKTYFRIGRTEFYDQGKPYLFNPIAEKVRLPKNHPVLYRLPKSGINVLEALIDAPTLTYTESLAMGRAEYHLAKSPRVQSGQGWSLETIELEIWKYSPTVFSQDGFVDGLSLILSMSETPDIHIRRMIAELEYRITQE